MELWFQMLLLIILMVLPNTGLCEWTQEQKVISNTATATFKTSNGRQFTVESAPDGNSIPGTGKGTPVIVIIQKPEISFQEEDTVEETDTEQ